MKNKKLIYEKIEIIIFFISIALIISSIILTKPLTDLDEIWNYNFSKNIVEGRLPYKDFNMIQMPLLPYISSIFLLMFGNQLLSMRIFAIICCVSITIMCYLILKQLKVNKGINLISILAILYLFREHFRIDYNFFSLLITLIIIYIDLKNKTYVDKANHKIDILIGVLAGVSISLKQTTGLFIAIATIFYQLIFIKDKETLRIFMRKIIDRIIGVLIPIVLLIIYFTVFGLWNDFIDYCILGIKTFSNKISYMSLIKSNNIFIKILSVIVPTYLLANAIVILLRRIKGKELDKNNIIIFAYACASIVVIYPISDEIHFLVGSLPAILAIIVLIYKLAKKVITKPEIIVFIKSFVKVIAIYAIICTSCYSIMHIYEYIKNIDNCKQINHFYYIPDSEYDGIKDVVEYVKRQNKKVYILDAQAAMYTIPIDQYNKNFDMFLIGNIGGSGEDGMIENIEKMENIQILVLQNEYRLNWQTPVKVINYVREHLTIIDTVGIFDIYIK